VLGQALLGKVWQRNPRKGAAMLSLETWEQTAIFDPADPTQKKIEKYVGIPGGYGTFYFNKVPTTSQLQGPFTDGISTGAGVGIGLVIASVVLGAGAWAAHKTGLLKRGRKAIAGLGGYRRRRRR
jgi:hypothetical protein